MEIFTIMVVRRTAKQVNCEGYKIKVNENMQFFNILIKKTLQKILWNLKDRFLN